jgi:flagellar FliL protein
MLLLADNAGKKTFNIKKYVIIAGIMIFMLMISCFLAYLVAVRVIAKEPEDSNKTEIKNTLFVSGGEFLTNLSDRGLIKVSIEYELEKREVKVEIEKRSAEVRDVVNSVLRSKASSDVNGENGMAKLRMDIQNAVNSILRDGEVVNVYFVDILVN